MKQAVLSENAPKPIGPYSQGIKAGQFLFLSGQIPLNPVSGNIAEGGIKEQAKQVMENIKNVLEAAGLSFQHIVKTTIFLKNINDFSSVNEIYAAYFQTLPPARSTVQVAALPKESLVEIEAVAYYP